MVNFQGGALEMKYRDKETGEVVVAVHNGEVVIVTVMVPRIRYMTPGHFHARFEPVEDE